MPDFTFQKSRCYASPGDHQLLLNALPNVGEPKYVQLGQGGVERKVCRLPDNRIWIHGTHESKRLAWVKMSASTTTPSAQLAALRPATRSPVPTPLGVPSDVLRHNPALLRDYEVLAREAFGPGGTTMSDPQFSVPNEARQDTVRAGDNRQQTVVAGPSMAAAPTWQGLYLPSMVPTGLLEAIVGSWPVGAHGDIVSPDGLLRRFQHQGNQIVATDPMNNTVVVARLT